MSTVKHSSKSASNDTFDEQDRRPRPVLEVDGSYGMENSFIRVQIPGEDEKTLDLRGQFPEEESKYEAFNNARLNTSVRESFL